MKEIKAVIREQKLAALYATVRARPDFPGRFVSKSEMYTAELRDDAPQTIRQALTDHVRRNRIELIVPDESALALFEAIVAGLAKGAPGGQPGLDQRRRARVVRPRDVALKQNGPGAFASGPLLDRRGPRAGASGQRFAQDLRRMSIVIGAGPVIRLFA